MFSLPDFGRIIAMKSRGNINFNMDIGIVKMKS